MIIIEYKKEEDNQIKAKVALIDSNCIQPKQKWIIFNNIDDIPVWFTHAVSWNYKVKYYNED